ncbi:MAG: cytochrome b/b6 domain-containing protein [Flavobacteriaceae bacterium]|nr:cytochrome b/b6 domain-containing protein [Flavobacteriaceae bacterium]
MKTSHKLSDRILHWSLAFSILFILLTIFLRLNWMEKNNVAAILIDKLSLIDISISKEQAIKIAKQIRKPMFDWHIYIGYVASGIFALRVLYNFLHKEMYNPKTAKERFQIWVYRIFYIFLGITLFTGLYMKFGPNFLNDFSEEVHKLTLYYVIPFLILHFTGILISELTTKEGIVSKMIGGDNK